MVSCCLGSVKYLIRVSAIPYCIYFRADIKFGRHMHLRAPAKNAKTADYSQTSVLNGHYKSPKWKDEQHLRRNIQVTLDTVINDFNSGQVYFYLYLNVFLSPELFGA